ncbi:olfactory receptor 6N2-like [Lissotriton helveticus]
MENKNKTNIKEFIIMGYPNLDHIENLLFILLLLTYLLIITGNTIVFSVIRLSPALQSPMYFFICVLSFLEIWYTAVTIPKMLANLIAEKKSISFIGCLLQIYFFQSLGVTEASLLTVMAYDRYLAICNPLLYSTIMTSTFSIKLAVSCWLCSFLYPVTEIILISKLPFCGPNQIEHIFCDLHPLMSLACTDTSLSISVEFALNSCVVIGTMFFILFSYVKIIKVILQIRSSEGRQKAFSTCAAHLTVVFIFFGSVGFMYIRLTKSYGVHYDKTVAVVYSVLKPLVNPIIYSLRNKEIRHAIQKKIADIHNTTSGTYQESGQGEGATGGPPPSSTPQNVTMEMMFGTLKQMQSEARGESRRARRDTKKIQASLRKLNRKYEEVEERVTQVEERTGRMEDEVTDWQAFKNEQGKIVGDLQWKIEDFENRQRRNNVRLLGLEEVLEGQDPRGCTGFVDYSTAFDKVVRKRLWRKLENWGIPSNFLKP